MRSMSTLSVNLFSSRANSNIYNNGVDIIQTFLHLEHMDTFIVIM